ncbi:NAD(P)/FAD-dependent oxidoreductase [Streptomyces marianii]|uniref:NAD(P)/FAD-dependent oxidoreductase n=1 Tax=Streptomyces marianii TaxID=1817406 RepID=A0A5R9DXW9_9ACTN|nr:NAD(P)/FAD-dependent oxidoreductase [Streptomyces marianii]TLQ42017.1 NAD(P)/FAD-dependent oxidoreductase [Streptomyces marianii]
MFDAIVVGARCAGSPTAMLLARGGHRVLLLERAQLPSDVLSTHFLWPHGMSYLNRWGLLESVVRTTPSYAAVRIVNEGISLTGEVPEKLLRAHFEELHGDGSGVVTTYASVRRRVLDKLLIDAAASAGADVREGCAVDELIVEDGRVVGVRGRTRAGTRFEERARIVVGADGRNSFVARALGLTKYDERPRCTFAYWTYYSGFAPRGLQLHRRGRLAAAVVPTNFDQSMTLVWGPSEWGAAFRTDVAGHFQQALSFVSPDLAERVRSEGRQEERFYGTLDQTAYLRPLYGPGWVLVGDAESFKDQCTATGMTHAFRDAELAATAIGSWLGGHEPLDSALRSYEERRRSQNAAAYYDYVCTLAEMRPLRHDELQLLSALRGNQEETDRYIATHADIAPVSEFFQASNLFLINDAARETSDQHAIFDGFAETSRSYLRNPFS